jgi:anti-sigma B factor antagonist
LFKKILGKNKTLATLQLEGGFIGDHQGIANVSNVMIDNGVRILQIDFSKVGYISDTVLGALVSLNKKMRSKGGEIILLGLNRDIKTLFELTKLDTLFDIKEHPELV